MMEFLIATALASVIAALWVTIILTVILFCGEFL